MTTLLRRTGRDDTPWRPILPDTPGAAGPDVPRRGRRTIRKWLADHPAWPISAFLVGYPVWWLLGTGTYMVILLAFPMAYRMYRWKVRDRRRIKLPPGFAFWLLFLLVTLAGVFTISLTPPGTITSPLSARAISFVVRFLSYSGTGILLLYAGNLTERELPRRRLAWLLSVLAMYTVFLGLGGVLLPHLTFSSPIGSLLPGRLQASTLGQSIMHPSFAQHSAAGQAGNRPEAPFDYTDTWGYCVGLLLPWIISEWWGHGTRRQRQIAVASLVIVLAPLLKAQDRGAYLAIGAAVIYYAVRLAARAKPLLLGLLLAAVAVTVLAVGFVPAVSNLLLSPQLAAGQSDNIRTDQVGLALQDANSSPLLGYGDTRHMLGSPASIAVGPNANCPTCGQYTIGSNGQLWLVLICSGYLGAVLFFGFFAQGIWRYRRDTTPEGIAGVAVLLVTFVYMFAYDATGTPLAITMLSYAVLWRNDMARREAARQVAEDQPGRPVGAPGRMVVTARTQE